MKIFIADDSDVVVERLTAMLAEIPRVKIVGCADSPKEALESIHKTQPDVVILDIHLKGGSGMEILPQIKKGGDSPLVIILTNYPFPHYRKKCFESGADYFFDKYNEFYKLVDILSALTAGSAPRQYRQVREFHALGGLPYGKK